jgi:hypothetical protein
MASPCLGPEGYTPTSYSASAQDIACALTPEILANPIRGQTCDAHRHQFDVVISPNAVKKGKSAHIYLYVFALIFVAKTCHPALGLEQNYCDFLTIPSHQITLVLTTAVL